MPVRLRPAAVLGLGLVLAGCSRSVEKPVASKATTRPAAPAATHPVSSSALAKGKPAPEVVGQDVDGKTFRLSDYRGKVVMLDYWATW